MLRPVRDMAREPACGVAALGPTARPARVPRVTGWPAPALMQDDCRGLFRWFASKPDARRLVREALARSTWSTRVTVRGDKTVRRGGDTRPYISGQFL